MNRIARALLPYGVIVAEYLLTIGAACGVVWLIVSAPKPSECVDTCWGGGLILLILLVCAVIALTVGLLVALVLLTVRLRRLARRGQLLPSGTAMVRMASRTAAIGLASALAAIPVVVCGGLPLWSLLH
jgi:steroid 5-alpha reductase family enzyme